MVDFGKSSSSSRRVEVGFKDRALRRRPFRPPERIIAAVGTDGSSSLSSLEIRLSCAVNVP